jgi:hypothetical protein
MKKQTNIGFGKSIVTSLVSSILTTGASIYIYFRNESLRLFAGAFFIIGLIGFIYYLYKYIESKKEKTN